MFSKVSRVQNQLKIGSKWARNGSQRAHKNSRLKFLESSQIYKIFRASIKVLYLILQIERVIFNDKTFSKVPMATQAPMATKSTNWTNT